MIHQSGSFDLEPCSLSPKTRDWSLDLNGTVGTARVGSPASRRLVHSPLGCLCGRHESRLSAVPIVIHISNLLSFCIMQSLGVHSGGLEKANPEIFLSRAA